jgi:hypothetical protein
MNESKIAEIEANLLKELFGDDPVQDISTKGCDEILKAHRAVMSKLAQKNNVIIESFFATDRDRDQGIITTNIKSK